MGFFYGTCWNRDMNEIYFIAFDIFFLEMRLTIIIRNQWFSVLLNVKSRQKHSKCESTNAYGIEILANFLPGNKGI